MNQNKYNFAIIFDMDGVLVDNGRFHFQSWKAMANKLEFDLTEKYFREHMSGRRAIDTLRHLAKSKLSLKELNKLDAEKEFIYRQLYKGHIKPVKGLKRFLTLLKRHRIKIALATSAPKENVDFTLTAIKMGSFFNVIVGKNHVSKGKPHPEVYLKAAKLLTIDPKNCIVIEDALNGIEAAKRAKMKVIAITTTNKAHELLRADLVIKDFTKISLEKLANLLSK